IGGLAPRGRPMADKKSFLYTLTFPAQQHKLGPGDHPIDPATRGAAGTIVDIDDVAGTVTLRRGPSLKDVALPRAMIPGGPVPDREQRGALARLASSILRDDGRYRALRDILARTPPRLLGRVPGGVVQTIAVGEQRQLAAALDASYLFIQGPPGTGKTWTGARLITDLMRRGRRVGVVAPSHKAIHNLLAECGTAARNVILLGDPLQLAQVSQGTHPPGTGASVLEHLLGDRATIAPEMGVFLERTRRMHPDVCRFISEIVYDGRLDGIPELARQATAFGTGLRFRPVQHLGNASASTEEAAAVASEIRKMLGASWTNRDGATRPLRETDFMVVAPYNAQVRRLREALRAAGLAGVPVGTVDKFQGREAPIVFYSMATSSAEDVPRSLQFLFSRNRLNVAVSRAMCLAVVVASPLLLESRARTIEQMRLINALCRFVDLAEATV